MSNPFPPLLLELNLHPLVLEHLRLHASKSGHTLSLIASTLLTALSYSLDNQIPLGTEYMNLLRLFEAEALRAAPTQKD